MASDYDTQLIESVAVRRSRLRTALLYGANPAQRRWMSTLRLLVLGLALAAVVAAACVGYSFIRSALAEDSSSRAAAPVPVGPRTGT